MVRKERWTDGERDKKMKERKEVYKDQRDRQRKDKGRKIEGGNERKS